MGTGLYKLSFISLKFSAVVNYTLSVREVWALIPEPVKLDTSVANGSIPLRIFFGAVLPRRKAAGMGLAIRFKLRRNTAIESNEDLNLISKFLVIIKTSVLQYFWTHITARYTRIFFNFISSLKFLGSTLLFSAFFL